MEHDKKYTCKNCKGKFYEWNYEYSCQYCDDGLAETSKDISFSGTHKCKICKGTGIESQSECDFCCEDCIDKHYGF